MHSSKELRFRRLLPLVLALLFPAIMATQSEGPTASAGSSPNRSVKQQLEQIRQHFGQAPPAETEVQSPRARFDPRARDDARQTSPLQAVRLPGAKLAIEN